MIQTMMGAVLPPVLELVDDLFTSDQEREEAKRKLLSDRGRQRLAEHAQKMSAILAEAQSPDPWTSRARPAFFYVMYIYILSALPVGLAFAFAPTEARAITEGIGLFLDALPGELYALFGTGFLGYGAFRSWEKVKGAAK